MFKARKLPASSLVAFVLVFTQVASANPLEGKVKAEQKGQAALCDGLVVGREEALKAGESFKAYFAAAKNNLREREFLVDLAELALIAEEHLLMMGPPGTAKSMFSDEVLSNIVDAKSKKTSYYKIQMTPETTLSETHGPLDYKTLTESNRYERVYSEGMLLSRNAFVDEIFDARANAQRNVLGLLNERAHAQGPHLVKGDIETVFAATNRYISEVYEKAGDDGPKALLDRFAFSAFVPGDFENTSSALALITGAKRSRAKMPELTFDDIEHIRGLVKQVEIPEYAAKFLTLLRNKFKEQTENMEQASIKQYKDKLKNGDEPKPPYRATKYMSPRSLGKAAGVLRAIVVNDWIKKKRQAQTRRQHRRRQTASHVLLAQRP